MDRFNEFLYRLVRSTHHVSEFDREKYKELIEEICEYYEICKGVSEFYPNVNMEKMGNGDVFCDYDNGRGEKVIHQIRIVTMTRAVIQGTIYGEKDAELDDKTILELDTLHRLILSFVSFRRLQHAVERFGFFDEDMYPNIRSYGRYLDIATESDSLLGKIAFHMDLRNFTMVNQEIGRKNGDTVIRNYYEILSELIGEEGIICRLGGDKFVGVFTESKQDRFIEIMNGEPIRFDDSGRCITVSAAAGLYVLPAMLVGPTVGAVMDKVTLASAIAKRNSEGNVIFYDQNLNNLNERSKWVQRKFREALANEEYKVFYQPKVDINKKEIIGAEALCRWFHEGTIIPPLDFIPVLEQGMDICDLDFYMLDKVCKDIRRWLDDGREVVKVSVNLSRKHLVDVDLLKHIMEIVDRNNVPHEYIEVELTETTTDVQFRDLKRVVSGLRREGISTAVDDFGIGYSSLNLIREIPWDVLKVDKNFLPMDEESTSSVTSVMFRHVISMAQDMGMKCVIEGVETMKQVELLKDNNCSIAQGYYFDKPLPVEDFEKRLDVRVYD